MAQLTSKVFQILDDRHTREGHNVFTASGVTTLEPGLLARYTSGSEVNLGTATFVHGIAYGTRAMQYRPTTQVFGAGEELVILHGGGMALISGDFFTSGTLPTAGSNVYAGASGLWDATASSGVKIARCIQQETVRQPKSGTGATVTVARVVWEITGVTS